MKRHISINIDTINDGDSLDNAISKLTSIKENHPDGNISLNFVDNDDCYCDGVCSYHDYLDIIQTRLETNEEYRIRLEQESINKKKVIKESEIYKLQEFNKLSDEIKNKIKSGINPDELIQRLNDELTNNN